MNDKNVFPQTEDEFLGEMPENQRPFKEEEIKPEDGAEPEKEEKKSPKGLIFAGLFILTLLVLGIMFVAYMVGKGSKNEVSVAKTAASTETSGNDKTEYRKANDILQANSNVSAPILEQTNTTYGANTSVDPNLPPPLIYQPENQPISNLSNSNSSSGTGTTNRRSKEVEPAKKEEKSKSENKSDEDSSKNSENFYRAERKAPNFGGMILSSEKVTEAVRNNQPAFKNERFEESHKAYEPPFSSVIPVRLLGSVHSLNSKGFVRLETTRAIEFSNGFTLPAQIQFVGRIEGSADKRLFISIQGYINANGNLVKLSGDVLSTDAAFGLEGKKHRLNSRFKAVFSKVAESASNLGQAYLLGRNGGNGGFIRDGVSPVYTEAVDPNKDTFVVIESGMQGYIFVNNLPSEARNNDSSNQFTDGRISPTLTDQQILEMTK